MDQHKLRALVFEKTGVKVDIDDPIFALVALNEAVLSEAVERHVALIDAASLELAQQARLAGGLGRPADAGARAGAAAQAPAHTAYIDATNEPLGLNGAARGSSAAAGGATTGGTAAGAGDTVAAAGSMSGYAPTPATPVRPIATQSAALTPRELRLLGAAAGVSVLSALLVLGGQALFFKPQPAPAPVVQVQAKTLTPEQAAAIQTSEKLARALPRLDPKTRSLLQAELQKP